VKLKVSQAAKTGILALSEHKLKEVPKSVLEIGEKLRILDLSNNSLLVIDLATFPNLKTLKLAKNKLETLQRDVKLKKLTTLDVSENKLKSPLSFFEAPLERVNLSHNPELKSFPVALFIRSLKSIDLSHCGISDLRSFQQKDALPTLEDLNLDSNDISEIPTSIVDVAPKLKSLSLEHNHIRSIPTILLKSPHFDRLNLKGNNISKSDFLATDGADDFLKRRENIRKKDAAGTTMADLSVCGLAD